MLFLSPNQQHQNIKRSKLLISLEQYKQHSIIIITVLWLTSTSLRLKDTVKKVMTANGVYCAECFPENNRVPPLEGNRELLNKNMDFLRSSLIIVQLSKPPDATHSASKTYGTIRLKLQTSSTWLTDHKR